MSDSWLRDVVEECFRRHYDIVGTWYGPNAVAPTDEARRACRLYGEAAERLQEILRDDLPTDAARGESDV